MAAIKKHLCDPAYDHTGKCKFCGFTPCCCDEKIPRPREVVVEKVFFSRTSPASSALARAAAEGSRRGSWSPKSSWGKESVMRSFIDAVQHVAEEELERLLKL